MANYKLPRGLRRKDGEIVAAAGWHLVPCDGDAHRTVYIDHCGACLPLWGKVAVPEHLDSVAAYREALGAADAAGEVKP